jgi:hypothetical protein
VDGPKQEPGTCQLSQQQLATMMKRVLALLALLASASAFVQPSTAFVAKQTALNMAKAPEMSNGIMATLAGAVPAILSSTAAVATEGTSEWFGVDDTRLLGVIFAAHWFILFLWLREYNGDITNTEEDFFGEIDYTRARK